MFDSASSHPLGKFFVVANVFRFAHPYRDGTVAGRTNDDDADGCAGRELRREGDPTSCIDWFDGCNYCGGH
jgi:hypothetical protein